MMEVLTLLRSGKKLAQAPKIEAFLWLVLDTHLIFVSQVTTHAPLELGQVIEKAKYTKI